MHARTTVGGDLYLGIVYARLLSGKADGKHQHHFYVMHNRKWERCTVLPWKGVRGKSSAAGEWKSSSVNLGCAVHEDFSFLPYPKVKGEGRRWKNAPATHVFNTLVYFIEVRDKEVSDQVSHPAYWLSGTKTCRDRRGKNIFTKVTVKLQHQITVIFCCTYMRVNRWSNSLSHRL